MEGSNEHYKLTVGEFTGNAGDSFAYHNKMAFSTEDMDNDLHERHCAAENKVKHTRNLVEMVICPREVLVVHSARLRHCRPPVTSVGHKSL